MGYLEARITNGIPISAQTYPWMVSLRFTFLFNNTDYTTPSHCGGSLIQTSPPIVMTAAHCVDFLTEGENGNSVYNDTLIAITCDLNRTHASPHVVPGDEYSTIYAYKYEMIHIHPQWNGTSDVSLANGYDIALLTFDANQTLNHMDIDPMPTIPLQTDSNEACCVVDEEFIIIGYGANSSGTGTYSLEMGNVYYVDPIQCMDEYYDYGINDINWQSLLCVNGNLTSACHGDSGGPAFRMIDGIPQIVGITSFGSGICGEGRSAMFTNVAHFHDWIMNIIDPTTTDSTLQMIAFTIIGVGIIVMIICLVVIKKCYKQQNANDSMKNKLIERF